MNDLVFEPVSEEVLPLLHSWLKKPHVRQWWGDPDQELELIKEIVTGNQADGFLVAIDEVPVGYVQSWQVSKFEDEELWVKDLPDHAIGVDIFIGPEKYTGKGVGPAILRCFCKKLFDEGASYLVIDPDALNTRAVSAYEKAGFKLLKSFKEPDGDTLIMNLTT